MTYSNLLLGGHTPDHAAARPGAQRPAAASAALAAEEKQAWPVSSTQDVRTRLWKGQENFIYNSTATVWLEYSYVRPSVPLSFTYATIFIL